MKRTRSRSRVAVVKARIPCSIANLGPGFDVHSLALQKPVIEVGLLTADGHSRTIEVEGAYAKEVETEPSLHAAGRALNAVYKRFGKPEGYVLRIKVDIPP